MRVAVQAVLSIVVTVSEAIIQMKLSFRAIEVCIHIRTQVGEGAHTLFLTQKDVGRVVLADAERKTQQVSQSHLPVYQTAHCRSFFLVSLGISITAETRIRILRIRRTNLGIKVR